MKRLGKQITLITTLHFFFYMWNGYSHGHDTDTGHEHFEGYSL